MKKPLPLQGPPIKRRGVTAAVDQRLSQELEGPGASPFLGSPGEAVKLPNGVRCPRKLGS